jgi:hypothetical protein
VHEFLKTLTPDDVDDAKTYASFVQQKLGVPCSGNNLAVLRKKSKEVFEKYPGCDWKTLCQLVDWARARKKRPPSAWHLVSWFPYAWADHWIELPDPGSHVDEKLERALQVENDPSWRRKIALAVGQKSREEVYSLWLERRGSLTSP